MSARVYPRVLWTLALAANPAWAQPNATPVSLESLIEQARAANPQLRAARARSIKLSNETGALFGPAHAGFAAKANVQRTRQYTRADIPVSSENDQEGRGGGSPRLIRGALILRGSG